MANLKRPLPSSSTGKIVHLYGTNMEVDKHTDKEIKNLPGQAYIFKAEDTGDQHALKDVPNSLS